MKFLGCMMISAAALVCAAAPGYADVSALPAATFYDQVAGNTTFGNYQSVAQSAATLKGNYGGTSSQIVYDANFPSISGTTVVEALGAHTGANANSTASLTYNFEISGPTSTVVANIQGSGSASYQGSVIYSENDFVSTYVNLDINGFSPSTGPLYVITEHAGIGYNGLIYTEDTPNFSINANYTLETNTLYTVNMSLAAGGEIEDGGSLTFSAYVDPMITLPAGYVLDESVGIGNSIPGAVPETSTWAMLLLGFAGIGFAGYRQRRPASIIADVL